MVVKIEFTPLPHCNILPFFKGFFKKRAGFSIYNVLCNRFFSYSANTEFVQEKKETQPILPSMKQM